jgi:uncharacterized protein YbgA (DUF1722 family)/uncharacterized protein YbbK (DUF523 family)
MRVERQLKKREKGKMLNVKSDPVFSWQGPAPFFMDYKGEIMREFQKPIVFISSCITFQAVRHDGGIISSSFVDALKPYITVVTHCPEVKIGLPVPRNSIRIVADDKEMTKLRLVMPATGEDYTEIMTKWVNEILVNMPEVDGFILKSKSPSCSVYDARIYPAKGDKPVAITKKGAGFFGGGVLRMFPEKIVEDEGRLNDERIVDNFLKRIFLEASFRRVKKSGRIKELINFQEQNKLMFMSYNQKYMRLMGGVAANTGNKDFSETISGYEKLMELCVKDIYRVSNVINTIHHAFGYFSEKVTAGERKYFLEMVEKYRSGKVHVSVILGLMRSYIIRFSDPYLGRQTFFEPYPEEILEKSAGK